MYSIILPVQILAPICFPYLVGLKIHFKLSFINFKMSQQMSESDDDVSDLEDNGGVDEDETITVSELGDDGECGYA